jgi:hypothetical protein
MKAKKALKRLAKVELLLSAVIDRYSTGDHVVHGFLDSASASLASARQKLDAEASAKKPPAKSAKSRATAKNRNGAARRKPNGADSGRHLTKTA